MDFFFDENLKKNFIKKKLKLKWKRMNKNNGIDKSKKKIKEKLIVRKNMKK